MSQLSAIAASEPAAMAPAGVSVTAETGTSFAETLARVSIDMVDQLKTAEKAAIGGVSGDVSVQAVVQAIIEAEQTLQTAIAIRERIVAAYQEISRMAI